MQKLYYINVSKYMKQLYIDLELIQVCFVSLLEHTPIAFNLLVRGLISSLGYARASSLRQTQRGIVGAPWPPRSLLEGE